MIKRFLCVFCAILFVFSAVKTASVFAENEKAKKCSIEITYAKKGIGFENLEIQIHRIAKQLDDGSFEKVSPYDSLPVSIHDITSEKEWQQTANTFESYIKADKIKPYQIKTTKKNGKVEFLNLETGLYLVCAVKAKNNVAKYKFDSFLVYLPLEVEDQLSYDLKVSPKAEKCANIQKQIEYKVVKLWKDLGYKKQRPAYINIDILKDGVVQKSATLSSENNWIYKFKAKDDGSVWTVVERNVSKNYKVTISKNQTTFTITNTHKNTHNNNKKPNYSDSPSMGDNFGMMFYFVVMLISGLMLIVIGVSMARGKKYEKV